MNNPEKANQFEPNHVNISISYDFLVDVISGSLSGQQFKGSFSYDPSLLKGKGQEKIKVLESEFNYLSQYTEVPEISFTDGNFERLIWVSGKSTERFGFNGGFERNQFGRPEEAFIRNGDDYFGYLDKNTFVDGAGKITYHVRNISYNFLVNVISGSLKGQQFKGSFSYDPSVLKGKGTEKIKVVESEFNYLSQYTGVPEISFTDGNFERLIWVSGKSTERFGFNGGFERNQFGRPEEAFIRNGDDYFGYLDKNTFVDGAGKITYTVILK